MNKRKLLITVSAAVLIAGRAGAGGARTRSRSSKTACVMQVVFSFAACGGDG
jgi:hypothetical protein